MIDKLNILIVGNGHYATGSTVLEGKTTTDKDFGILLPSVLELQKQGLVNDIYLAARNGKKFTKLRKKLEVMNKEFGWKKEIKLFPKDGKVDENAYKEAMKEMPRPGAVLIAVPDKLHKDAIMEAIKNKQHFLVVKPIVINKSDLEEILKAQLKASVFGMVDYHKCFDEANLILKDEYRKGKYGKLQHVFSKQTQRRDMLEIYGRWLKDSGTNVNHYLGSHYIHMVGFITGAKPLNVRAIGQYGMAKEEYKLPVHDLIETQVEWKAKDGSRFVSYHVAGWTDPKETSTMTYQEMHLIGTEGHIESDQRFRGYETVLSGKGQELTNPYFFNLNKGIDGKLDLDNKYGFKSVKTFVKAALEVSNGEKIDKFDKYLPTIKESERITAILEAVDQSLRNNSAVIQILEL